MSAIGLGWMRAGAGQINLTPLPRKLVAASCAFPEFPGVWLSKSNFRVRAALARRALLNQASMLNPRKASAASRRASAPHRVVIRRVLLSCPASVAQPGPAEPCSTLRPATRSRPNEPRSASVRRALLGRPAASPCSILSGEPRSVSRAASPAQYLARQALLSQSVDPCSILRSGPQALFVVGESGSALRVVLRHCWWLLASTAQSCA